MCTNALMRLRCCSKRECIWTPLALAAALPPGGLAAGDAAQLCAHGLMLPLKSHMARRRQAAGSRCLPACPRAVEAASAACSMAGRRSSSSTMSETWKSIALGGTSAVRSAAMCCSTRGPAGVATVPDAGSAGGRLTCATEQACCSCMSSTCRRQRTGERALPPARSWCAAALQAQGNTLRDVS